MTTRKVKTYPALEWVINSRTHKPSSALEALMVDEEDDWFEPEPEFWDEIKQTLTPDEFEVSYRMYALGWSTREAADDLRMSVGKVHSLKVSAFDKLREVLSERVYHGRNEG